MSDLIPFNEQKQMADVIAKSGLFGFKDPIAILALMAVAQSEGRHPASVAKEYHFVQGRPALKADAMLARFQRAGGSVEWTKYTDAEVEGVFSHPQGGTLKLSWTFEQAKRIGLAAKDNWKNYPRAMLRARVISEGIRTVYPGVLTGEYTPEEVMDFEPVKKPVLELVPIEGEFEETENKPTIALYVPNPDGSIGIYKHCVDETEWRDTYFQLVNSVKASKKLTDAQKDGKLAALKELNQDNIDALIGKELGDGTEAA
jgi:hypothetical protein